jgi:hypothetical protein
MCKKHIETDPPLPNEQRLFLPTISLILPTRSEIQGREENSCVEMMGPTTQLHNRHTLVPWPTERVVEQKSKGAGRYAKIAKYKWKLDKRK